MKKHRYAVLALLAGVLLSGAAGGTADYARERKWADEITPAVVVGEPLYLKQANGHEFLTLHTPVEGAKAAVVVVHGKGMHPDWAVNGVLRSRLSDAGFTTLAVQMPVLAADATTEAYDATLPEAAERLRLAVAYLREQGYQNVGVVSHSMGSRMAYHYLRENPEAPVAAWVSLGIAGPADYGKVKPAVLDLYGSADFPEILKLAPQRKQTLKDGSAQVVIAGSDHYFTNKDDEVTEAVTAFFKKAFAARQG